MDITARAAWTVAKDGRQVQLTIEDLQQLLNRLVWSGDLTVSDERSGRVASGSEELDVSLIDESIQISLRSGDV